jgi:hypothetical protein
LLLLLYFIVWFACFL